MDVVTTVGQYFSLLAFFGGILTILVIVIFYSKWQIYGPKWENFVSRTKKYWKNKFDKSKPKVQRGAIIENTSVKEDLENKEKEAKNAQELLAIQNERIRQQKQVKQLEKEMEEKKLKRDEKLKIKEEKRNLKEEQKETRKQIKEDKKKKKEQKKEKKKKDK